MKKLKRKNRKLRVRLFERKGKVKRLFGMKSFNKEDISRIIEMAWEDRTPFEAIEFQFGLKENDVRGIYAS